MCEGPEARCQVLLLSGCHPGEVSLAQCCTIKWNLHIQIYTHTHTFIQSTSSSTRDASAQIIYRTAARSLPILQHDVFTRLLMKSYSLQLTAFLSFPKREICFVLPGSHLCSYQSHNVFNTSNVLGESSFCCLQFRKKWFLPCGHVSWSCCESCWPLETFHKLGTQRSRHAGWMRSTFGL